MTPMFQQCLLPYLTKWVRLEIFWFGRWIHISDPDQGRPEPTQFQWNRPDRHNITVNFF
jgi:hypothetical protein